MLVVPTVITEWNFYIPLVQAREECVQHGWARTSGSIWMVPQSQPSKWSYLLARLVMSQGMQDWVHSETHQEITRPPQRARRDKETKSDPTVKTFCLYLQIILISKQPGTCSQLSPQTKQFKGKKKKNYSSSKRFWEALDNLASGEYISWPLSLGNQIHLLGVGVESPLSFPCQCLFLDLHAWAQAEFPVNNCLGGREAV